MAELLTALDLWERRRCGELGGGVHGPLNLVVNGAEIGEVHGQPTEDDHQRNHQRDREQQDIACLVPEPAPGVASLIRHREKRTTSMSCQGISTRPSGVSPAPRIPLPSASLRRWSGRAAPQEALDCCRERMGTVTAETIPAEHPYTRGVLPTAPLLHWVKHHPTSVSPHRCRIYRTPTPRHATPDEFISTASRTHR